MEAREWSTNPVDNRYVTQVSAAPQQAERYDEPYAARPTRPVPINMPPPPVSQMPQKGGLVEVTDSILMPPEEKVEAAPEVDGGETEKKSVTIAIDTSGGKQKN